MYRTQNEPAPVRPIVLVTGGAGYIGSHVCKELAQAGYLPVAFDNLSGGHRDFVRWGPLFVGDLLECSQIDEALRLYAPRAIIHLAGVIAAGESVAQPAKYYCTNVSGTLNLLSAMQRHEIGRIVFSSSAAVYGDPSVAPIPESHATDPISPYGKTKLHCEHMMHDFAVAHGIRAAALRYFNAAGADPDGEIGEAHPDETHLIPIVLDVAAGKRPFLNIYGTDYPTEDGTCIRDYVHVTDLADAHVRALDYLDREIVACAFNLGGGTGHSVNEIVERTAAITERPIATRRHKRRPGDPSVLLADTSLARAQLGWSPRHSDITQLIATAWHWHRRRHSAPAVPKSALQPAPQIEHT